MAHKLRLNLLRHRFVIYLTVCTFMLFTILITNVMLMTTTLRQSERNEQILRGLSCISLIQASERTTEKIVECIEKNSIPLDRSQFHFNTVDETDQRIVIPFRHPLSTVPEIVIDEPTTPVPTANPDKHTQTAEVVEKVQKPVQKILKRLNPLTGLKEFKFEQSTHWQNVSEWCEIDNSCED